MSTESPCPDRLILEQLLLGRLAEPGASRWEEHLSHCSTCVETLARLETECSFSAVARNQGAAVAHSPASEGEQEGQVVRGLIGELKRLLPAVVSAEGVAGCPPAVGQLAQYRVLEELGRGGMGVVYRAEDVQLRRPVALKVMLPKVLADSGNRQRFLREARAAAAVEHERIATIYQVGEDRGVPFLAMQLLQGETLEARLRRQPGPHALAFVLRVGREIAEGLEAAHARGLIHRDVKPGNIWLQAGGDHVKILDFGLARVAQGDSGLTSSGLIVGTPGFLAPEQASEGAVDERTDLFSLGVVLFLLATGRLPFQGKDPLSLLRALAVEQPPPVSELNPAVPPALSDLIRSLLAREPDARPHSAREVIEALAAVETARPPPGSVPPPAEPGAPVVPRRRIVLWGVLCGLGIASALGLWLLFPSLAARKEKGPLAPNVPADNAVISSPKPAAGPGGELWKLAFHDPIHAAVFCSDGKHILCGGDDEKVRLLETATGREVKRFDAFSAPIWSLAVAGEGGVFVTGGGYYVSGPNHTAIPKECRVQVWNLADGKEQARFEGHREPVGSVAISADGRRVLSACGHDRVRLWDVPAQRQRGLFGDTEGNGSVAMTPDGQWGLHVAHGREICLLDLDKGEEVRRFEGMTVGGSVSCLRFGPEDDRVLSGCTRIAVEKDTLKPLECVLLLRDSQRGRELKRFEGHGAAVRACVCSRDGRYFLSGSGTGLWGRKGARWFDCTVRLWDAATGKELRRFEGHAAAVLAVDISPDGRFGLSVGEDRTLRLWNLSPSLEDK